MISWEHEIGDVLIINYKDTEQVARVADYEDSLDNRTPLYVNLRVSGGMRWGERKVKIQPSQIVRVDPDWYERQESEWQASIKAVADASYAKMSPAQRQRMEEEHTRRRNRSPLDIAIDRACGIE